MKNILSYQQLLLGKEIKEWVSFHTANETEYTSIAARLKRYDNIADDGLYRIDMHPRGSDLWYSKERKYKPIVVRLDKERNN